MNKHHETKARETLLKLFLERLEYSHQNRNGGEVTLRMNHDTADIVIEGIRRALAGEADPFRLKPPRGIKTRLSRAQWQFMAAVVARLMDDGVTSEEAFKRAGKVFDMSPQAAKQCYYEERQKVGDLNENHWREYVSRVLAGEDFSKIVP